MAHFKTNRFVAVSPDTAFAVAADVGAYQDFLPLLTRSVIRGPKARTGNRETFMAEMTIGYEKLGLRESFISRVECDGDARTVVATANHNPFKNLRAIWTIAPASGGSIVGITIDYEMRSMLMQFAVSGAMDIAVSRVMSAFEARAKSLQTTASQSI